MSSSVRSASAAPHKPASGPSGAHPPAGKGSNPASFSRLLQGRPGFGKALGRLPGKKGGLPAPAAGLSGHPPEGNGTSPLPRLSHPGRDGQGQGHSHHGQDPGRPNALLDPLVRSFAHGQLSHVSAPPPPAAPPPTLVHLDQIMTKLVRKVAWGGDGERGAARIELGAGELAGATIVVESDNGALSVDVELPPGVAADVWRERLEKRFKGRGFNLVELNVR